MNVILDAFKKATDTLHGVDIVVNAAGIIDGAHWEKEVLTNVVRKSYSLVANLVVVRNYLCNIIRTTNKMFLDL